MKEKSNVFDTLRAVDCREHSEQKKGGDGKMLTYLSWAWAWDYVKKMYPDATYQVREWDNRPYLEDQRLGYLVETSVTIQNETLKMRLPVMNESHKAMRSAPYTYKTRYGEKTVNPADMTDINTAIMRCLVKNLAMFGLGLYIYSGEDLPEDIKEQEAAAAAELIKKLNVALGEVGTAKDIQQLQQMWNSHSDLHGNPEYKARVSQVKKQLMAAQAKEGHKA